ncbi:hypothetical protein Raf01_75380 [Rugosimonospora africana]|uniref:Right handed beta helix domain-containing protein n=2 Tax=Rugosimonospora africana TaxID=556532 RepID=A0A8J3QZC7_9ACTN|nr:hypothetical protein Raf01_75380 [Rugosimonospora africana]
MSGQPTKEGRREGSRGSETFERSTMKSARSIAILAGGLALAWIVSGLTVPSRAAADTPASYYVSTTGSDSNDGSIDAPFATLAKARDAVRALSTDTGLPAGGVNVYLRTGTYTQTSSFALTAADSGTATAPITYQAYPGERVRITGEKRLNSGLFTNVTDPAILNRLDPSVRSSVLQTSLKPQGVTDYGTIANYAYDNPAVASPPQLVQGDTLQTLARWPNTGYTTMGTVSATTGNPVFAYTDPRPSTWATPNDARIAAFPNQDWAFQTFQIDNVNTSTSTISASPASEFGTKTGARYYYFNVLEELDTPGEWYLDRSTGILYVIPATPITQQPYSLTMLNTPLMTMTDTSYVTVKGLNFSGSNGTGVAITNGNHVLVTGCTFQALGLKAGTMDGGSYSGFSDNVVHDTGSGGFSIGAGNLATLRPGNLFATNNDIYRYATRYQTYSAAIQVYGVGNRISHNKIHDAIHLAIKISGNDQIIEYNDIYNVVTNTADSGAIYSGRDWTQQGTVIRYNYLHDLGQGSNDDVGIYLDDMESGQYVYGNVFENLPTAIKHSGRDNNIENNIMINVKKPVLIGNWGSVFAGPGGPLVTELKAVPYQADPWLTRYPHLANILNDQQTLPKYNSITKNVYVGSGSPDIVSTTNGTSAEANINDWPTKSVSDVGFVNAAAHDYDLTSDAAVFTKVPGFQAIPFGKIGIVDSSQIGTFTDPVAVASAQLHFSDDAISSAGSTTGRAMVMAEDAQGDLLDAYANTTFSSSDPALATIAASGYLNNVATGTSTISAQVTLNGATVTATKNRNVVGSLVKTFGFGVSNPVATVGSDANISPSVLMTDGSTTPLPDGSIIYSSEDPTVATVSGKVLHPVAPGMTRIVGQATYNGQTTRSTIYILVQPVGGAPLPSGWSLTNYGTAKGGLVWNNGQLVEMSDGKNVYGTADDFTFVHTTATSTQTTVEATVEDLAQLNDNVAAGIMIRDHDAADSKEVSLRVTPSATFFIWRTDDGGATSFVNRTSGQLPTALKIVRNGDTFTGYFKYGTDTWVPVGSATVSMGSTTMAGTAMFSKGPSTATIARYSNVIVDDTALHPVSLAARAKHPTTPHH